MDYPITDQPTSGFGMPKQGGNLEGLERLAQLRELTVKQRHPGCLERELPFIYSFLGVHDIGSQIYKIHTIFLNLFFEQLFSYNYFDFKQKIFVNL